MQPSSEQLHRAWDVLITVAVSAAALVIPVRLVLREPLPVGPDYFSRMITVVFFADVLVHLFLMRRHEDHAHDVSAATHIHYPFSWLLVDLMAALPLGYVTGVVQLQLLRLVKLARVAEYMRHWRRREIQNSSKLALLFFAFWMVLTTHWLACGWIALGAVPTTSDHVSSYLAALYWSVQTLSTVGYGDLTPSTNAQILYAIVVMIFGVGVYGYIIGNVANILANIDPVKVHRLEKLKKLMAFMSYRRVPPVLQKRIHDYYNYLWEKRLDYDESTVISGLPPSLRTDVSLFLMRDIIHKVPLFRGANDEFIREIALHMRPVVFMPGDFVFREGEVGKDMYFISRGELEVVARNGQLVQATLREGDFFGEIALIQSQPRTAGIRAVSYCDLYRLDKEMFERVAAQFPEIARKIAAMAKERQERN